MKTTLAIIVLALLMCCSAFAQQAESTIDHVTDDTVVLDDGTAWETTDPTVETWNEGENVVVTDNDVMVNTDQNEAVTDVQPGDDTLDVDTDEPSDSD